jgi:hypothetical protein
MIATGVLQSLVRCAVTARALPAKTKPVRMLYLFVFTQFRTQTRCAFLLEFLSRRTSKGYQERTRNP